MPIPLFNRTMLFILVFRCPRGQISKVSSQMFTAGPQPLHIGSHKAASQKFPVSDPNGEPYDGYSSPYIRVI